MKDGDTIVIRGASASGYMASNETVRLYGIDCPELKQPFGEQARHVVDQLVTEKYVWLEKIETDRYGRTIGKIALLSGASLSQMLVRAV